MGPNHSYIQENKTIQSPQFELVSLKKIACKWDTALHVQESADISEMRLILSRLVMSVCTHNQNGFQEASIFFEETSELETVPHTIREISKTGYLLENP